MRNDDLPPLPEGWKRTSGKSGPRDGKWFIQLRGIDGMGFADTRVAYEPRQIVWKHEGHSGDVVAVRRADGPQPKPARPASGSYE